MKKRLQSLKIIVVFITTLSCAVITFAQSPADFKKSDELTALAASQNKSGEGQAAYDSLQQALALNPKNAAAYFQIGELYRINEDYQNVALFDSKALAIKPDYADAYLSRGDAYTQLKKWSEALSDFNNALKFNSRCADCYALRGYVKGNLNYPLSEETADYHKALEIDPKNYVANLCLENSAKKQKSGISQSMTDKPEIDRNQTIDALTASISTCDKKGDPACMVQFANQGIVLYPTNEVFYFFRGVGLRQLERYGEAIIDFTKVLAMNPKFAAADEVYLFRGEIYLRLHNWELAEADLKKGIEINPEDKDLVSFLEQIPGLEFEDYRAKQKQLSIDGIEKIDSVVRGLRDTPDDAVKICNAIKDQNSEFKMEEMYAYKLRELLNSGELKKFPDYQKQAQEFDYTTIEGSRNDLNKLAAKYNCRLD